MENDVMTTATTRTRKRATKKPPIKTNKNVIPRKTTRKPAIKPRAKKNPVPLSQAARVKKAAALYQDFSGEKAEFLDKVTVEIPDVLLSVGPCLGIMYETVRDGKTERYIHEFKKKSRPHLAASFDGAPMVLIGGSYQFTERGIIDK